MSEIIYKLDNITKEYQGKKVLDIDSLIINKGGITAVIGPSGSGKSTLLQILNGLISQTTGTFEYQGVLIKPGDQIALGARRSMAIVFQKPVVFNTTVFENIAFGLRLRGEKDSTIIKKVTELAVLTGLSDKLSQKAITLSGGEAQRTALARALIIEPKVLLLDEPTANLDPGNIAMIEKLVLDAQKRLNTTVIIVTHNLFQTQRISDNIIFMLDGSIIENNSKENIFNRPANAKTKAYISGEMIY